MYTTYVFTRTVLNENTMAQWHAGNATQSRHPPLIQKTRIHIQPHTLHHSLVKNTRESTQIKVEDMTTALARSVVVTYHRGLKPVYMRPTSLLSPSLTL